MHSKLHGPLRKVGGMMAPLIPMVISIILITGFTFVPERFDQTSNQAILFYALPGNRMGATVRGSNCFFSANVDHAAG